MADPTDTDDLSQGYCIELHVKADGTFVVDEPEPEAGEAQGEAGEPQPEAGEPQGEPQPEAGEPQAEPDENTHGEPLPNIGQALRAILKMVEAHPIGASPQKNFEAGYATGPHMM